MACALALTILASALPVAKSDVSLKTWPSTAFACGTPSCVAAATSTTIAAVQASPPCIAPCSARFFAMLTAPASELVTFWVVSDGGVNLWVDDHLVVDKGTESGSPQRNLTAELRLPLVGGKVYPIRLDYLRATGGAPSSLALWWSGNATAPSVVPAAALTAAPTAAEAARVALKERMLNPPVSWQTFYNPSMGTHVNMPSGFAVQATLADLTTNDTLGDIIVFRRSNPAITYVGAHSYNGSDFTELRLDSWKGRDCTVVLRTTVATGGRDILFLAASNGTACARMALLLTPTMLWARDGRLYAPPAGGAAFAADCPGFPTTSIFPAGVAPQPFPKAGPLAVALPLGGGPVGYSSGSAVPVAVMETAIDDAAARQEAILARWGDELAPLYEPIASILAWNTMFTPLEGVVTPVSRGFDWDNFFLAYMASMSADSLDIAYSNLIQNVLMRTIDGFVPNFASGLHVSYDRTEPQIGAFVALQMYKKWGDASAGWVIDCIFDALMSWNDWVWNKRRGEGVLAGPDGHADLVVLGSDPNAAPRGIVGGDNTLQDARYESGLDNSPMYDGGDDCASPDRATKPVCFDSVTTHHMNLYDVGMTALYLSDTAALMELATARKRGDVLPTLQERFDRVSAATASHLWDPASADGGGAFANVLFNGSFYPRLSPTSLFPLISGQATPAQAAALGAFAGSPRGLCLNDTYAPLAGGPAAAPMLVQWWDGKHDNAGCLTDACLRDTVNAAYNFIRVEAVAAAVDLGPGPGMVPLYLWHSAARGDYALTNASSPPDAAGGYALVRQEGWCWSAPPAETSGYAWGPATPLTLWYSAARKDYQTCGSADCLNDVASGYEARGTLCWAFNGTGADNLPCKFGGNSIARSDAAFFDNDYWRGRIWGPHIQLIYWGLANPKYKDVPSVQAARAAMVKQGRALVLQEWALFRQVTENYNGIIGAGEDVGNADPFYTWGALPGFISFLESGAY